MMILHKPFAVGDFIRLGGTRTRALHARLGTRDAA